MDVVRKEIQTPMEMGPSSMSLILVALRTQGCCLRPPSSIQPSRARRGWANAASCLPGEEHGDLVWWGGGGLVLGEGCRKSCGALVQGRSSTVPGLEAARAEGDGKGNMGEARWGNVQRARFSVLSVML